jgi:hypothetical protein
VKQSKERRREGKREGGDLVYFFENISSGLRLNFLRVTSAAETRQRRDIRSEKQKEMRERGRLTSREWFSAFLRLFLKL